MTPDTTSLAGTRALLAPIIADVWRRDDITPIRDTILALVEREASPTLAAVARLPGAAGDKMLTVTGTRIVLWDGLSWNAISALTELQLDRRIRLVATSELVYLAEGEALDLPLAQSLRPHKRHHWLPVVLIAVS